MCALLLTVEMLAGKEGEPQLNELLSNKAVSSPPLFQPSIGGAEVTNVNIGSLDPQHHPLVLVDGEATRGVQKGVQKSSSCPLHRLV